MQEPGRLNLRAVLQKNMRVAERKSFLHRVIYIASYVADAMTTTQDTRSFIILMDSNIKLVNEDFGDEPITGFGLFYTGFFINILEGPEESILKHLATLTETFDKDISKTPEVTKMKILLTANHINKRYFTSWNGRQAIPPVLLGTIEQTQSPEVNSRHIQQCVLKLYKMSEYLRNLPANLLPAVMDNISELCRTYLPEVNLLKFLLNSPALSDVRDYIRLGRTVPDFKIYHEVIWPVPPDFVPANILSEDTSKKLMSMEAEQGKEKEGETEAEPEKEGEEKPAEAPNE